MNYQEARAFIEEKQRYGGEISLNAIRALIEETGHPDDALKFIHIAGTNGKGSLLAYISTTLTHAGYRTGRYISPTLYSYRERIQVDGEPISREDFVRLAKVLKRAVAVMKEKGIQKPSPFELETVLGFLYFKEMKCDFVVLECGLGGRDDATNVINPKNKCLAVFASISLDHMEYLGNTLTEIATVKAGIATEGIPLVMAPQKEETVTAVTKYCQKHHNPLVCADISKVENLVDELVSGELRSGDSQHLSKKNVHTAVEQRFTYKGCEIVLHLAGAAQVENAITAFEALTYLGNHGVRLTGKEITEGLAITEWNGRFTILSDHPIFVVDGAHNPDAAKKLKASVEHYFPGKKLIYIMGVLADKDYESVLQLMVPLASKIFTIAPPDNPRALSAENLSKSAEKYRNSEPDKTGKADNVSETFAVSCRSLEEARKLAVEQAGEDGIILAFGSLSFIGPLTSIINSK